MTHEVYVLCNCDDIECCRMERYVSDVRIAVAEVDRLQQVDQRIEQVWGVSPEVVFRDR